MFRPCSVPQNELSDGKPNQTADRIADDVSDAGAVVRALISADALAIGRAYAVANAASYDGDPDAAAYRAANECAHI